MATQTASLPSTPGAIPPQADPWDTAPFVRREAEELRALIARLGPSQRLWLSGYLAGTIERGAGGAVAAAIAQATPQAAPDVEPATILYGSHSGNGEQLARQLAERLAARQVPCRLLDMIDCRKADLEQARTLFLIVSTHGDGEPPERALPLHELLLGRRAPRMSHTRYAVLALGDSSYEHFCATGRQFDERLAELGATRLQPRVECDVDFDVPASGWIDAMVTTHADAGAGEPAAVASAAAPANDAPTHVHTRKHPYAAEVFANQALTARGSSKQVRHIELSLEGSGIHYEPGDAIGVVVPNPAHLVDALLQRTQLAAEAPIAVQGGELPLREALARHFEIGPLSAALVKRHAQATGDATLAGLVEDEAALARFIHGRDLLDLVTAHPVAGLDAAAFAGLLRPITPRLYSIASSNRVVGDEVHLTVGKVEFEAHSRRREGIVSGQLAQVAEGGQLPLYLHRNNAFRLPADAATPIVMIGAGTGIAPFRAFVADREATGASGRNWLFFGDRAFELDFLYQSEWLAWRRQGLLTQLDVAFSRDQPQKVYVQHRIAQRGALLWAWLQEGAHLYVCGDATGMARDVEQALLDTIRTHGNLDDEAAREFLLDLQRTRRYQKDVY